MNRSKGGDGVGVRKKVLGPRPNGAKDQKDEDLLLFREMHKREKDRVASLFQPVSEEFEANGNYAFYGMAPGKKGAAYDSILETGKNDYDWLKTPPATPLFPSLEMDTNGPELAIQREITIVQPLTRFAGNSDAASKGSTPRTKSPNSKPKLQPRYSTPSGRPSISLSEKKNVKSAPVPSQKLNQSSSDLNLENVKKSSHINVKPVATKESHLNNILASNFSKSIGTDSHSNTRPTKPKSRGVSPQVRSTIPSQISGLSDETPPNLRTTTDRSVSASRARSNKQNVSVLQKQETNTRSSSSASATRSRKQENDANSAAQKDKFQQGSNRTQVLGSRMVDRFLNARMSSSDERQSKIKLNASMYEVSDARKANNVDEKQNKTSKFNTSMNEGSGFGRLMSKSSLDMALKHMEFQRDSGNSRKTGAAISGRRSVSVTKRTTSS